jgi:hypothetical protein
MFLGGIDGYILNIVLFIVGLFVGKSVFFIFTILYVLLYIYLLFVTKKQVFKSSIYDKYSKKEVEVLAKYYLAIDHPFGAKGFSITLNSFRMASFLWVIFMFIKGEWYWIIPIGILYFFTGSVVVKLDPYTYLATGKSKTVQVEYETLLEIAEKVTKQ